VLEDNAGSGLPFVAFGNLDSFELCEGRYLMNCRALIEVEGAAL
jgi:hypothetical protein